MNSNPQLNTAIAIKPYKNQKIQKSFDLTHISFGCLFAHIIFFAISFGIFSLGIVLSWLAYDMSSTNYFTSFFCAINAMLLFISTDLLVDSVQYPKIFREINTEAQAPSTTIDKIKTRQATNNHFFYQHQRTLLSTH